MVSISTILRKVRLQMKKSVAFCTLGCKVNQYETEAMRELFENAGYCCVDFEDFADVYVINTCTVTAVGDRKSRQMIRRAKRINPDAFVIVCGCYAQTAPQEVAKIDGVDLILGTQQHSRIAELAEEKIRGSKVGDISRTHDFEPLSISGCGHRSRAYLKIQEGCNQFCSYCIIPYARGPIRSRSAADIIAESRRLVQAGFSEIVYVGIHVASYGLDTKELMLDDLLIKLNGIDGLRRIRLSSIEPMTLNRTFCEKIKGLDKLCPHFHLSLQSGCDATLARMNRKYTTAQYREIVDGLRESFPDCAITTDIMVGFPGETDTEFAETLKFAGEIGFADAHIFKYSRRKGTPADTMPGQIPPEVKDERSKQLISLCTKSRDSFLKKHLNTTLEVLFEDKNGEYYEGKTANYITVFAKSDTDLSGSYHSVAVSELRGGALYGTLMD